MDFQFDVLMLWQNYIQALHISVGNSNGNNVKSYLHTIQLPDFSMHCQLRDKIDIILRKFVYCFSGPRPVLVFP